MKYFYDTEFLEGSQKRRIGKIGLPKIFDTKNTIDLISIGIVEEDGGEYYSVSKDFNLREAWNRYELCETSPAKKRMGFDTERNYWIRHNVLKPIFKDLQFKAATDRTCPHYLVPVKFTYKSLKRLIKRYGKTNNQIKGEIYNFVNPDLGFHVSAYNNSELKKGKRLYKHFEKHNVDTNGEIYYAKPEFYNYYGAYDHVVLCWLFGKMIELPKGFPMYSIDLRQTLYSKYLRHINKIHKDTDSQCNHSFEEWYSSVKTLDGFPKVFEKHSALSDAKWNKSLYDFLNTLN